MMETIKKGLTFSAALDALKAGDCISRSGWNGKGMWLMLTTPEIKSDYPTQPCICMKTADNKLQPGWLASQADMLANDWCILREEGDSTKYSYDVYLTYQVTFSGVADGVLGDRWSKARGEGMEKYLKSLIMDQITDYISSLDVDVKEV